MTKLTKLMRLVRPLDRLLSSWGGVRKTRQLKRDGKLAPITAKQKTHTFQASSKSTGRMTYLFFRTANKSCHLIKSSKNQRFVRLP